jgi:ABC-type transport system involved in multi-copper enzyme maturation permease subunit
MKVIPVALNTFRESVRDRILYNLVLFVLLLVAASLFIGDLSLSEEKRMITNMGLTAMSVFGVLISIFIGIGLVYKEIDKRTIYSLLAKPIQRYEFILGKYFGLCFTLLVNTAVMALAVILALLIKIGPNPIQLKIVPAAWLIFLELMVMTAVALLFSSFSSPALSALLAFFVFVIGRSSTDLKLFADNAQSFPLRAICNALYYTLPNLGNFNHIGTTAHGESIPFGTLGASTVYAALYIFVLLSATVMTFQKRNFK